MKFIKISAVGTTTTSVKQKKTYLLKTWTGRLSNKAKSKSEYK